jgi:Protein of unknown function (DUF3592)
MTGPIAFACATLAVDALALTVVVRNLVRASRSVRWPLVQATVVRSRLVAAGKGTRPRIEYRYQAGGRTYESARVVVGMMAATGGDGPARLVARHPEGTAAAVAVDPQRPGYSVLVPGIRVHQVFVAGFTIAGVLMSLPLLWPFIHLALA